MYTCVAQELCVASLEKYVDPQQKFDYLRTGLSKLEVLRNTTDGVIYIHKTAIKNNNLSEFLSKLMILIKSNNINIFSSQKLTAQ